MGGEEIDTNMHSVPGSSVWKKGERITGRRIIFQFFCSSTWSLIKMLL